MIGSPAGCARRIGAVVLAALFALMLPACVSRTPAAEGRGQVALETVEFDWPGRPDPTPLTITSGGENVTQIDHGRRGMGRIYEFKVRSDGGSDGPGITVVDVKTRRSIFEWSIRPPPQDSTSRGLGVFTTLHVESLAPGMFIRLFPDPTFLHAAIPNQPKGTVLFVSSFRGMEAGERAIFNELLDRGWAVLASAAAFTRLWEPISPPSGEGAPDLDAIASGLADRVDETLAERAYAMEGFLDLVHEQHPELASRPVVAVGCSAGAIVLPTMSARLDGSIDAAVLIAGGADVFRITTRSSFLGDHFEVAFGGRPATDEQRRTLEDLVLARSKLDPFYTSQALVDVPVLMLHAPFDTVVPAAQGDLLYERLGRPERWSYAACGHYGLFVLLATQANAVSDWIEATVSTEGFAQVDADSP